MAADRNRYCDLGVDYLVCLCGVGGDMTAEEERRMVLLEMRVKALLSRSERMQKRIDALREYVKATAPHSGVETYCPTCKFLREDLEK